MICYSRFVDNKPRNNKKPYFAHQNLTISWNKFRKIRMSDSNNHKASLKSNDSIEPPPVSERCLRTQMPVITLTRRLLALAKRPSVSLGQGVVYWGPPAAALQRISDLAGQEALLQANVGSIDPNASCNFPATQLNEYVPNEGIPSLRERLRQKIREKNGLTDYDLFVTPGANHGFTAACLAVLDEGDTAVLFEPYYFDHEMSLSMLGGGVRCEVGKSDPKTLKPDLAWLEERLMNQPHPPKMVVLCTPNNPTGVVLDSTDLNRAADICTAAGVWLVVDATYEDFMLGDAAIRQVRENVANGEPPYKLPRGPNILHLFSMSKAYGMMGWRVGYICYPLPSLGSFPIRETRAGGGKGGSSHNDPASINPTMTNGVLGSVKRGRVNPLDPIGAQLLKIMDITCICAPAVGQQLALACLDPNLDAPQDGLSYVERRIASLASNRNRLKRALAPLAGLVGEGKGRGGEEGLNGVEEALGTTTTSAVFGGDGAIYFWARLPAAWRDDVAAVKWLIDEYGICVVPGSAFGAPGHVRVSFANLAPGARFEEAAERLERGLKAMVDLDPEQASKELRQIREDLTRAGVV